MMGHFAVAAAGGETANASNGMAQGKARRKGVHGAQRWQLVSAHVPGGCEQGSNQSAGKNASGLQRVETENVGRNGSVMAPVVHDVQDLGADDAAEDDEDAKVPGAVEDRCRDFGIAHADPKADQHADGHQHSVGGQREIAKMKELWEHWLN